MKRKRFTEEQIIAILKQADSGTPVKELCRTLSSKVTTSGAYMRILVFACFLILFSMPNAKSEEFGKPKNLAKVKLAIEERAKKSSKRFKTDLKDVKGLSPQLKCELALEHLYVKMGAYEDISTVSMLVDDSIDNTHLIATVSFHYVEDGTVAFVLTRTYEEGEVVLDNEKQGQLAVKGKNCLFVFSSKDPLAISVSALKGK